jgi:hypothetical protein
VTYILLFFLEVTCNLAVLTKYIFLILQTEILVIITLDQNEKVGGGDTSHCISLQESERNRTLIWDS